MPKSMSRTSRALTVSSTARKHARPPLTSDARCTDGVLVAIDPGLQGTGIAKWVEGDLLRTLVLNTPSKLRDAEWHQRANDMAEQVLEFTGGSGDDVKVVCEMPEFFAGAGKMMGWKTGDLQRLTYLVGLFAGRLHPRAFEPVPVHVWKGQLPKRVVQERIEGRLGHDLCRALAIETHAWDAVGIGLWALGRF